jgi:hypothetical protein
MTWTAYQVTLRLITPLHCGLRKVGNVQQTRPYLSGRNLWGALTARLTRDLPGSSYAGVGNELDEVLGFSYFYPTTDPTAITLWPWDSAQFAGTFLGSYATTALQDGHKAEEGSLHEVEFIAPSTRIGQQVYLLGYIFEKNPRYNWQTTLNRLQLGGERGYGWGKVVLERGPIKTESCFGAYAFISDRERPGLQVIRENTRLLAHTRTTQALPPRGALEPLVGLETDPAEGHFGGRTSVVEVGWLPGGRASFGEKFTIEAKGVWQQV